jgi:hypothetical protein
MQSEDKPNATALLDLEVEEIAFVDKGAGFAPRIMILKRRGGDASRQEVTKSMTLEEVMASLSDEQKAVIMAALEHAKMMAGEESKPKIEVEMADKAAMEFEGQAEKGEMAKPLVNGKEPEEYMKRLGQIEKAREADRVALAKAQAEIAVLKYREKVAKYRAEAESEFAAVPGASTEQVAKLLVACDDAAEGSDLKALRGVLKAAHEAVRASDLLKAHGAPGRGPSTARAAWDMKVEELAKRDSISKTKAIVVAMREAPELYTAAREEV